jgi:hypothetical protein
VSLRVEAQQDEHFQPAPRKHKRPAPVESDAAGERKNDVKHNRELMLRSTVTDSSLRRRKLERALVSVRVTDGAGRPDAGGSGRWFTPESRRCRASPTSFTGEEAKALELVRTRREELAANCLGVTSRKTRHVHKR